MKGNTLPTTADKGEIILYQPNETIRLEVRMENETVWLTQSQLILLFQSSKANISEHLHNIFETEELPENSTVRKFRTVQKEGFRTVTRELTYYNLDVIISVGYRVNTKKGILFRQWATQTIKEHLLKNNSINQQINNLEKRFTETTLEQNERFLKIEQKIDFFVRTSLPPVEGIFFENQIFDAYVFVSKLIKSAKESIVLIDNYIDESVLTLLDKRNENIPVVIFTQRISPQLQLDIDKHNAQYQPIEVKIYKNAHDRFLVIDNDLYHIGASIKDLGKKLFAFSKITEFTKIELLERLNKWHTHNCMIINA